MKTFTIWEEGYEYTTFVVNAASRHVAMDKYLNEVSWGWTPEDAEDRVLYLREANSNEVHEYHIDVEVEFYATRIGSKIDPA